MQLQNEISLPEIIGIPELINLGFKNFKIGPKDLEIWYYKEDPEKDTMFAQRKGDNIAMKLKKSIITEHGQATVTYSYHGKGNTK